MVRRETDSGRQYAGGGSDRFYLLYRADSHVSHDACHGASAEFKGPCIPAAYYRGSGYSNKLERRGMRAAAETCKQRQCGI